MVIDLELKTLLIRLAQKYEAHAFLENAPSNFMRRYKTVRAQEVTAFIVAKVRAISRG